MKVEAPVYNSVDELAEHLGLSRSRTYDGLRSGQIPSIRLGKRFIVPIVAIATWLANAGNKSVGLFILVLSASLPSALRSSIKLVALAGTVFVEVAIRRVPRRVPSFVFKITIGR